MIIHSIEIVHKNESYSCCFDDRNLIYNSKNVQGKTTLIRFMIYGLGYNIPITHNIDPNSCKITIRLTCKKIEYTLVRKGKHVDLITKDSAITFPVNNTNVALISKITGCDNQRLLSQILGTFYIDQESGWVVFNRGKVISKQDYNIDQLIYCLSDLDDSIFIKKKVIEKEIRDNKNIINQFNSQSELDDYDECDIHISDEIFDARQQLELLQIELKDHLLSKKMSQSILKQNDDLIKLLDSFRLKIIHNDEYIPVTHENIVGFDDSKDFYNAKITHEDSIIANLNYKIAELNASIEELIIKNDVDTALYSKGARRTIKIDTKLTKRNIDLLNDEKRVVDNLIEESVSKEQYKDKLNNRLVEYAQLLDVSDLINSSKLILEHDFRKITGTNKQKLILAYRFAALTVVSEYLGLNLPIIIDSIDRETDEENIGTIISFINRFQDHQIIMASINNIPKMNTIYVSYPLLKQNDETNGTNQSHLP